MLKNNAPEFSEVPMIIVGVEDEEVNARDILRCKRAAINRGEKQLLDKVSACHRSFGPLTSVLFSLHGRDECFYKIMNGHSSQ